MDVAAPTTLPRHPNGRLPDPLSPSRPRPRISIRDYLVGPTSPSVPGTSTRTDPRVAFPQSTVTSTAFPTASLMPEPPGRMRRGGVEGDGRGGSGEGRGDGIERGRKGEAMADVAVAVQGRDDGETDGAKDVGRMREDEDGDGKAQDWTAQAETAGRDTMRRGWTVRDRGRRDNDGSSVQKAVVIDEGYGSLSFGADASSTIEKPPGVQVPARRSHQDPLDDLFEDHVATDESGVLRAQGEGARTAVLENAEEEAAIEKVNSLFRRHHSRARDGRAEGPTIQASSRDGDRHANPETMDNGTRGLLEVLKKEAEMSVRSVPGAGREGPRKAGSVLARWQAEVEARKREAVERARSARASDGTCSLRPTTAHGEAGGSRVDPEDDTERLRLAHEGLIADLASRTKAKREREQVRLRKEREANERASMVDKTRNAQIAMAANQERNGTKARPAREEEAPMAAEARTIAGHREEERRKRMDVGTEAKRKQEAERLASLRRKAAAEAVRRVERNKIDEERRAKAAESAGRPPVRIKVEDSGGDDAVRSTLARDRAARQAAAERSRSRQVQIGAEEKAERLEDRPFKTSETGRTSVALRLSSSGDEALAGNRVPSAPSSALESQLHRANEILQAAQAQKRLLELEAEARRVQAECTALKRRAEEADAEDVIDQSLHKKARSIDQSVGGNQSVRDNQSMLGSRGASSVEDMLSPHETEMQAQRRPPTKTLEERMKRKKETDRRWRLKKQAERKLLQAQSRQGGIQDSTTSHQSKSSPAESDDNDGTDSGPKQPMGLRALCTPGSISNAQDLQEGNDKAKSGGPSKSSVRKDHDEPPTSNGKTTTASPRKDDKAKSHVIRDRAAKDEAINDIKAKLAIFQQPRSSQGHVEPEPTGTTETPTVDTPVHQEREETVSSDEDEDESEAVTVPPLRPSTPRQTLDPPEESQPPRPRPTCARKTLPAQVHATASEDDDDTDTGVSDNPAEPPTEPVWAYHVTRREWGNESDGDGVGHTTDGPYWSRDQANRIAATEVHRERGDVRIRAPMAFSMTIDALGMQTHSVGSDGGNIATAVERALVPPSRAHGPMADRAWLPPRIFVVLEDVRPSAADESEGGSGEHVPRASSIRVRGVFTVLDLANREASSCALDHRTSRLGESQLDQVIKAEMVMKARGHLQTLDRDCRTFETSCAVSDGGGVVGIWVEEHPVVGPRN